MRFQIGLAVGMVCAGVLHSAHAIDNETCRRYGELGEALATWTPPRNIQPRDLAPHDPAVIGHANQALRDRFYREYTSSLPAPVVHGGLEIPPATSELAFVRFVESRVFPAIGHPPAPGMEPFAQYLVDALRHPFDGARILRAHQLLVNPMVATTEALAHSREELCGFSDADREQLKNCLVDRMPISVKLRNREAWDLVGFAPTQSEAAELLRRLGNPTEFPNHTITRSVRARQLRLLEHVLDPNLREAFCTDEPPGGAGGSRVEEAETAPVSQRVTQQGYYRVPQLAVGRSTGVEVAGVPSSVPSARDGAVSAAGAALLPAVRAVLPAGMRILIPTAR